ncbi:ATP-binding protein [Desulfovibrio ferrophilus]|uniref:histidine kinase n=1 Tax=Desulfovibrio ferrophilus TaxID=241368 RepID=A0A2Z6B1P6_9BACT|nr:ATP-binding protein [Desulfovibrio ferrophilus]BBD09378.1 sensory box protein [Desulfovibrio ferrophilus]
MASPRQQSLSSLLGLYLSATLVIFATALLIWTYDTAIKAVNAQLLLDFDQRFTIARNVLTHRLDLINANLSHIAVSDRVLSKIHSGKKAATETELGRVVWDQTDSSLDILFMATAENNTIWADASAPFLDVSPFLPLIAEHKQSLAPSGAVLHLQTNNRSLTMLVSAVPLVRQDTGKVIGTLFGGIVLGDNFTLVEGIRSSTESREIILLEDGRILASTSLEDSAATREIRELGKRVIQEDFVRLPGELIASFRPLALPSFPAPLVCGIAIADLTPTSITNAYMHKGAFTITLSIVFFLGTILLIHRVTRPSLNRLLDYTNKVRSGDTQARFQPVRINELNIVGQAMEEMVAKLQASQSYVEGIVNSMPSVLIGVDHFGVVTLWNDKAAQASGKIADQIKGRRLDEAFPELASDMEMILASIREGKVREIHKRVRNKDGIAIYENVVVYPLAVGYDGGSAGAVVRVDDVSERVRIEEIIVQTEKMISVGGLAAGMAHEINNPLGGILQGAQNIERRLSPDLTANIKAAEAQGTTLEAVRGYMLDRGLLRMLDGIRDSGERAAKIVRNMLNFSRGSESRRKVCDLNALVDHAVELASSDYDLKKKYDFRRIDIQRQFHPEPVTISCTEMEIEQVVLNLLQNAAYAMADSDQTDNPPRIILRSRLEPGFSVFEVEDNGPGLSEDVRKRIFEPFYTTKPPGLGTGLGLSVSYFIITQNHGGTFSVESEPGKGAKFIIKLPAT